jgi:hypothetical protein
VQPECIGRYGEGREKSKSNALWFLFALKKGHVYLLSGERREEQIEEKKQTK